jgi:hypothetical protein
MLSYIREKKWHLLFAAVALSCALGSLAYSQGYILPPGATVQKQLYMNAEGAPPTCTNCTITTGSSDFFWQVQVTTTGAVPLTFGTAFTNTPYCVMSDNTTNEGVKGVASTSGVTISGGVTSDFISGICVGH